MGGFIVLSVMVLILASTGAILLSLGVTAVYVAKTFEQATGRPLFVIQEQLNVNHEAPEETRDGPYEATLR